MNKQHFFKSTLLAAMLIMVLGLAAFGKSDTNHNGVTDNEILIGSHLDLSGPLAGLSAFAKKGMEMRVKEINDAGGIHGRKIRLIIEDNAYNPAQAIAATNKLINKDKVFMFVGNMGSATAGATKPIISRKKIPQIYPTSAADLFYRPYDRYSFGGWVPYYDQARVIIAYFVKEKGKQKIGIMYQDDEMGAVMLKGVQDQLAEYGMELTAKESYKRGATVFSTQIAKLKKARVDFLVLGTVVRETVGALIEARKQQWNVDMCGMSPTFSSYILLEVFDFSF